MAPLMDQILLFGDSITEFAEGQDGFSAALRAAYVRRLDVVNRGLSGYNTDMALRVLDRIIPTTLKDNIRLTTIFFGANDSCAHTDRNDQCVPLPDFRSNLIKIIQILTDRKNPRLILITNPPIDERTQEFVDNSKDFPLRRTAERTKRYADAIKDVGKDMGIPVADLWGCVMEKAGWNGDDGALPGKKDLPENAALKRYLIDGLHLSGEGYKLLTARLWDCIGANYPDQLPENLPYVLPRWDDGDAWRKCGETDHVINHRRRQPILPFENGVPLPSLLNK